MKKGAIWRWHRNSNIGDSCDDDPVKCRLNDGIAAISCCTDGPMVFLWWHLASYRRRNEAFLHASAQKHLTDSGNNHSFSAAHEYVGKESILKLYTRTEYFWCWFWSSMLSIYFPAAALTSNFRGLLSSNIALIANHSKMSNVYMKMMCVMSRSWSRSSLKGQSAVERNQNTICPPIQFVSSRNRKWCFSQIQT